MIDPPDVISFSTATLAIISGVASAAFTLGVTWTMMGSRVKRLEERQTDHEKEFESYKRAGEVRIEQQREESRRHDIEMAGFRAEMTHFARTLDAIAAKIGAVVR